MSSEDREAPQPNPTIPTIEELYEALADLPLGEQERMLDERCAGRPAMRARVQALLEADRLHPDIMASTRGGESVSMSSSSPHSSSYVGRVVRSHRIIGRLDEGGMGVVYRARHQVLDMEVAIKVLRASLADIPALVSRFMDEARLLARLRHPGIVQLYDIHADGDGTVFIIMELLDGESLRARLRRVGHLSQEQTLRFMQQVCTALAAVHRAGVIHRDLKPGNLFVVPDPDIVGGERIKILDFGIAKPSADARAERGTLTHVGMPMGTPPYMSPEQCLGVKDIDLRTDLYALGVIMFQLLSGRLPFSAHDAAGYREAHLYQAPPDLHEFAPHVSSGLAALVARLMAKNPRHRFESTHALLAVLDAMRSPAREPSPLDSTLPLDQPAPGSGPVRALRARIAQLETPFTATMERVTELIEQEEAVVVLAARRAGSTTFARQLHHYLSGRYPSWTVRTVSARPMAGEDVTTYMERMRAEMPVAPDDGSTSRLVMCIHGWSRPMIESADTLQLSEHANALGMGLEWASERLIAELLERTGRRPNLIALACDAAIRALEPLSSRVIEPALLRAVLDVEDASGSAVARFFGDLGNLIEDPDACRIDRMVMFATVRRESFTLTDVRKRLEEAGVRVPIEALRESLARLTLAYVIDKRKGAYVYPVPLVRDVLLSDCDDDPDEMLAIEAREA